MAKREKDEGLTLAIKAAGSGKALAAQLGITQSAVSQWQTVPLNWVIEVERVTKVSRRKLRPDLFASKAA